MRRENLVEQHKFLLDNPFVDYTKMKFDNWIIMIESNEEKWIQETTEAIAEWRGIFRSAYMKWAITVNGLFIDKERYDKIDSSSFLFNINSLRPVDKEYKLVPIAEWDAQTAAKAHFDSISLVSAYGLTDMYSCLEEFVFNLYRIYWKGNPDKLIQGKEFGKLRFLKNNSHLGQQEKMNWEQAFNERLDCWQRRKVFDNLGKVFLAYCNEIALRIPSNYTITSIETWAECITGLSIIRNCIMHGNLNVPKELADFCKKPYSLGYNFRENDELKIEFHHLQQFELFLNQLLTGINLALIEKIKTKK